MNTKDKEQISLMFINMAKETVAFLSSPENQFYHSDSFFVSSFQEEREQVLVHLLHDPVYAAKFSEEYLEKLLKEKIEGMIRNLRQKEAPRERLQKIARRTAEDIFNTLDSYNTNLRVYLPVTGVSIQLEEGKFELGNITFQNMTHERIDEVIGHITSVIMEMRYTSDEKQAIIKFNTEQLQEVFKDKESSVYAVYHVVAEPLRAEERARAECYQVFDLLRYALPMLSSFYLMKFSIPEKYISNDLAETYNYAKREKKVEREQGRFISFGLQGEVGTNTNMIRHVIILRDSPGFNWNRDRKERFASLELDPQALEIMNEAKVFEASQIIKKGEVSQTNFERTILRSIHWFANAQTPMQPEYVLLSLMSSIEAFLNPPGEHEKVTTAIIEGVAALGGMQGYKYTKKRIEELYAKRSALSHGDRTEILERDISELRAIAFYIIHQMIQRADEFTTQEQLYEEVKRIREDIKERIVRNSSSNDP